MANKIKYLKQIKLRDGSEKWAFNPPQYIKERLQVGFEQFDARIDAVHRCMEIDSLHQRYLADKDDIVYVNSNTVLGMLGYYKQTQAWSRLADNSKRTYNQLIKGLSVIKLGSGSTLFIDMLAQNVRKDHVQKLYAYLMEEVSPHRARHTIKFLKRVWNVCEQNDKLRGNPFKIIQLDTDPICDVVWTERQVTRFVEASDDLGYWSIGTLALLCYDLCQRPGDMRQLRWDNFDGETFTFVQEKTKTPIIVDASPRIISRIVPRHNQAGADETIVNYEKTGKPYDRWKYNEIAQKIRKHCMLPERLKMKFLRHSGATELAENGATEDQIAAVTGHKSRQMLNIYVKKTKKLASSAQNLRFG